MTREKIVAVVGLGYVGLPLALAFGKKLPTIGFDISDRKIEAYQKDLDPAGEVDAAAFQRAEHLTFTANPHDISKADVLIIAVPTPIDDANQPDLRLLRSASEVAGAHMKQGAVVVYESTVYPGVTEEVCVPVLERASGMKRGSGFKVGYSPERINPGDHEHTLEKIIKIVSGEDEETLDLLAGLYSTIIEAGIYRAPSIKVAEASKVIENTQRDLNIALVNELAKIFNMMEIDTLEVLEAAGTKWNFSPYRPGLVGGHCVGVDPYYLTHQAQRLGYHPEVILAGRRINDGMGKFIAEQTIKHMTMLGERVKGAVVLIMGLTFKENCADLRNSRVHDIIGELKDYGVSPAVWDPVADPAEAREEYGVELVSLSDLSILDAIIAAVPHQEVKSVDTAMLRGKAQQVIPLWTSRVPLTGGAWKRKATTSGDCRRCRGPIRKLSPGWTHRQLDCALPSKIKSTGTGGNLVALFRPVPDWIIRPFSVDRYVQRLPAYGDGGA